MRKLLLGALLCCALALPASAARLPITAARDWWPVWSPNDLQIAFTRINGTGRVFSLEVLHLDTHRATLIGTNAGQLSPSWSPDSSELAYAAGGILYVVHPDGTGKHRYVAPVKAYAPAWRPGPSGEIAYLSTAGAQNTDLWVADERWAQNVIGQPSWAPDGSALAFARDDGIYIAASRETQQRIAAVANPSAPVWSPDGTWLAYTAARHVWIVRPEVPAVPQSLAGPFADIGPLSWSREGDALSYTVRGALELTSLSGKTTRLTGTVGVGTSFAHHGDLIAFAGSHPGCPGHASIRIYEDSTDIPSLTGGCVIAGTSRADVIFGTTRGGDVIAGGAGNDAIHADNGHRDTVLCGRGRDTVWADRTDRLVGCEVIHR